MNAYEAVKDALIAVAILNVVVSIAIAASSAYTNRQKILQILFVWVVPGLGGLLLGLFMLTQRGNVPRTGYPSEKSEDLNQISSGLHPPDQER